MQASAPSPAYNGHFGRGTGTATGAELAAAGCAPLEIARPVPLLAAETAGALNTEATLSADPLADGAAGAGSPTSKAGGRAECSSRTTRFRAARMSAAFCA